MHYSIDVSMHHSQIASLHALCRCNTLTMYFEVWTPHVGDVGFGFLAWPLLHFMRVARAPDALIAVLLLPCQPALGLC